jgi:hypothetical protein
LATDLHRALDEALLSKSILVSQRPPTRGFGVFNQSVCTQPLATVSANFVHISMLNADETGGTALYAEGDDDSSDVSAQFVMPGIGTGSHYHGNNKNFPLLDIVCQRLGRRAGRLPDWYPVVCCLVHLDNFQFCVRSFIYDDSAGVEAKYSPFVSVLYVCAR